MDASRDQKHEIKFRVTSKATGQKPWSEKWAVKMGEGEEFVVTDEILKFPSHEISGRIVCTFSMIGEKLQFEYRDKERICSVSGNTFAGAALSEQRAVTEGDFIEIGESIRIEIVKAPALPKKNAQEDDGPGVPVSLPDAERNEDSAPHIDLSHELSHEEAPAERGGELHLVPEAIEPSTPVAEPAPKLSDFAPIIEEESSPEPTALHARDAGEESPSEENEEEIQASPSAAYAPQAASAVKPKKSVDLKALLLPVSRIGKQILSDRNTRAAAMGAVALMGGVLLWKVVNAGKYTKSARVERNLADTAEVGELPHVEIEPLSEGLPLAEIQNRNAQFDALDARIKSTRAFREGSSPQNFQSRGNTRATSYPSARGNTPTSRPDSRRGMNNPRTRR
jgi:hypothetical protein